MLKSILRWNKYSKSPAAELKQLGPVEITEKTGREIGLTGVFDRRTSLIRLITNVAVLQQARKSLRNQSFLNQIAEEDVPSNFTTFYNKYYISKQSIDKKIKFNNKILHQSKLVNYFNGDYAKSQIEQDLEKFLKKIKKDKKYFLSKKDIIFIEALKSDGIQISKKFDNLYEIKESEMPKDIQSMIENDEIGAALLRIIEVIGPERIENLDEDTVYFIINTLNQLNVDLIRNKLLLKVLPLKV